MVSVPRLPRAAVAVASLMAGRSSTVRDDAAQSRAESSDAAGGRGAFIVRMCVCLFACVARAWQALGLFVYVYE